jgi:hypothetical protein
VAATNIIAQRYTTQMDEPFVVFLIGMRVNSFLSFRKWGMVASAFPKMVAELQTNPDYGFLGGESFFRFFPLMTCFLSYWRSFEHLERFARGKGTTHSSAWREFNRKVGYDGSVGIWHETYQVEPGKYEVLYGNMPLFGLAKVTGSVLPAGHGHHTNARGRMTGTEQKLPAELEIENYPPA